MKAQIVSFHCVLKNTLGKVISSTFNKEVSTQPSGEADVLQGLADGLQDLKKGEKRNIMLPAEKAYGFYDPSKVIECARGDLSPGRPPRRGDHVVLEMEEGTRVRMRVVEIRGDRVTLDGNHPLAGQDLIFEIEATDARDATAEEILSAQPEIEHSSLH